MISLLIVDTFIEELLVLAVTLVFFLYQFFFFISLGSVS